jgi:hypothetical protein
MNFGIGKHTTGVDQLIRLGGGFGEAKVKK